MLNVIMSVLKVRLRRLYGFTLNELCHVNHKKFCNTFCLRRRLNEKDDCDEKFPKKRITGGSYFENVIMNNPTYQDIHFNESLLRENAESTNELVVFLRDLTQIRDTIFFNDRVSVKSYLNKRFHVATHTLLDFIEIFYLIYKCKNKLIGSEKKKLCSMLSQNLSPFKDESNYRILTLALLMTHYNRMSIPSVLVSTLLKRFSSLTKNEIVATFYVMTHKRQGIVERNFDFAPDLCSRLKDMTLDEVATIALGCFRYKISLGGDTGNILLDILIDNLENLNSFQAGSLSKYVNFLHCGYDCVRVHSLLDKVLLNNEKFTVTTLVHLAKIRPKINFTPTKYLEVIKIRLMKENEARTKDIERFLMVKIYRSCDRIDSDLLNCIEKNISYYRSRLTYFPRSIVSLLNYLICLNVYKEDLIDTVLSPQFLNTLYKKYPRYCSHELCSIDCSVELERPNYKGNRFPIELREKFLRKNFHDRYASFKNYFVEQVHDLLVDVFGTEYVTCRNLLPHLPYCHSLMCFNSNRQPLTMKEAETNNYVIWTEKKNQEGFITDFPKFRDCSWLVFIVLSCTVLPDGINMNLFLQFRVRQLKALGLYPAQIDIHFLENIETHKEKQDFLKQLINEVLDSAVDNRKKCNFLIS